MHDPHTLEVLDALTLEHLLTHLLAEGLVTPAELVTCRLQWEQQGLHPLSWLLEQGRISEENLQALQQQAATRSASPEPLPPLPTSAAPLPEPSAAPQQDSPPDSQGSTVSFRETPSTQSAPKAYTSSGTQLLSSWDRYRLLKLLGQGGMGQVYLALDPRLQRNIAIKLVKRESPQANRRLVSEARAQARIHHTHVCQVYEVGEVQGQVYIAMQLIQGSSLASLAPQLGVEALIMVLRDAALGVHAAHQVGIIHRDLKPSNILVERKVDGQLHPYVLDFGLAAAPEEDGLMQTGELLGTPPYMSPEQARGEHRRLDRRADVYSLGATLYHVLVGRPPFAGHNALDVIS
ncbi:MAG: protein kinase domain-containing protein [Myxococcota bacterium]